MGESRSIKEAAQAHAVKTWGAPYTASEMECSHEFDECRAGQLGFAKGAIWAVDEFLRRAIGQARFIAETPMNPIISIEELERIAEAIKK